MPISTTIKKDVFEKKMEELKEQGYFIEYKPTNDFWNKRLLRQNQDMPTTITFLIGSKPEKFKAVSMEWYHFNKLPKWVQDFFNEQDSDFGNFTLLWGIRCEPL